MKRPLRGPRQDNIKIDFQETICKGMDWFHLVLFWIQWQAHMNTSINLRIPYKAVHFFTRLATTSFLKRLCSMEVVEMNTTLLQNHIIKLLLKRYSEQFNA
jgi:hypothetical protein